MSIMKISLDELNLSYVRVNELKKQYKEDGIKLPTTLEVSIDRNPLTDDYFDDKSEFVTPFKLKFELTTLADGQTKAYFLLSEVEILDSEEEDDN